jgi:alkaline phosphatase D
MLGAEQETWLTDALRASPSTWSVIANQTVFSDLPLAGLWNMDQWDGYPASQQRILDVLAADVANPVVITGDIHAAGISELKQDFTDPAAPTIGTELVGTSISSNFPADLVDIAEDLIAGLPYVRYVNARQRGYSVVDLTPSRMQADYRVIDDVANPDATVATATTFTVDAVPVSNACPPSEPPAEPPGSPGPEAEPASASSQPVSPRLTG